MALYKLILAYDGTQYAGFQRQAKRNSVQLEVENALRKLGWQGRAVMAAGRTDSGVHASGQVISFHLDWQHGEEILLRAFNAHLPQDIAAQSVCIAPEGFHPRYDATARLYCYQVYLQADRHPLKDRYAWRLWPAPSLDWMNEAATNLLGEHDFAAFGKALKVDGTTIRTVNKAQWTATGEGLQFEICANAFLYHMVRRIVHVLVQVGFGHQPTGIVRQGFEKGTTGMVALAPAKGLTLVEVQY